MRQNGGMIEPPEEQTHASMYVPPSPPSSGDQLRSLITRAFEVARLSGRPDWQEMTVAVLKNRLLDLTERSFNEMDYGSRSIGELVRRVPDLLLVDESKRPPTVKLVSNDTAAQNVRSTSDGHVRTDLWNSVIDYRSGQRYIWDGSIAVPDESTGEVGPNTLVLPTIQPETMGRWRDEFANSAKPLVADDPELQGLLERWRSENRPARALPGALRGRWAAALSSHVIQTLTDWFSERGITIPLDLVQPRTNPRPRSSAGAATSDLRELVMRCVRVMTDEELRDLRLPPAAVLRAHQ